MSNVCTNAWSLVVAVLFITAWGPGRASDDFDWASYQSVTLDELVDGAPQITEGMDIFLKKRQFDVKLEEAERVNTLRQVFSEIREARWSPRG